MSYSIITSASGVTNYPYSWNMWNPQTGWSTQNFTINMDILGISIKFDYYLSDEKKLAIANLNFNGYKYWKCLKDVDWTFGEEIDQKIDERVKILSRKSKLEKIPN